MPENMTAEDFGNVDDAVLTTSSALRRNFARGCTDGKL